LKTSERLSLAAYLYVPAKPSFLSTISVIYLPSTPHYIIYFHFCHPLLISNVASH
jgi:hypothetical protein